MAGVERTFRRRKLKEAREKIHEVRKAYNKSRRKDKKNEVTREVWEMALLNRGLQSIQMNNSTKPSSAGSSVEGT